MKLDARLGYMNKGDQEGDWKEYARNLEERNLDCSKDVAGYYYNCSMLPLFDHGALHHDFYLLNIRLPTVIIDRDTVHLQVDEGLGKLVDLWLLVTNQNGG